MFLGYTVAAILYLQFMVHERFVIIIIIIIINIIIIIIIIDIITNFL